MKEIEGAFDEIYKKYAKMLYGYVLPLCRNPATAEDVVQTTFLKAMEHADSFEGKCEVSTWLCQIARNTWVDMCRRTEQKNISMEHILELQGEEIFSRQSEQQPDILQGIVEKEETTRMYQKIHRLNEPYKEVLMLRITGCLSFRDIGEIFGKSETWGRVTYYRAKEKLKNQMGDE